MTDPTPLHLGTQIRRLRQARGLTQAQLAKIAGIPRATWTNLESGEANPTLAVLLKVSTALQTRLEELLAPPRTHARIHTALSLPTRKRGGVTLRKLLPEPLPGLDFERMELPPGANMTGIPHTVGTREYLTCESGRMVLSVEGTLFELSAGDVVVFRGDQRHGYRNPSHHPAVAYSAVAFAPISGEL